MSDKPSMTLLRFSLQTWESRYVLLLWLSIVCMIPFDMVRLDGRGQVATGAVQSRRPVVERIMEAAKVKSNHDMSYTISAVTILDFRLPTEHQVDGSLQ